MYKVNIIDLLLKALLLIAVVIVFVPFSPLMPSGGLDASWAMGMNQAVAQGLRFGRDLIFTFGPYASVYTKIYHPATDFMMLVASLYLAASYFIFVSLLVEKARWHGVAALIAILLCNIAYPRDALLFSYPLIVALFVCRILISADVASVYERHKNLFVVLAFAPLGLLPLIKGTMLVLCAAISLLCAAFSIIEKKKRIALLCLVSPLASMVLFWSASGQSVLELHKFFSGMMPIVSGYTEAMAIAGPFREVIFYAISSILVFVVLFLQSGFGRASKVFLALVYFIYLFLAFKAGFVRHDGHAIIAASALIFAVVLFAIAFRIERERLGWLLLFPVLAWVNIDDHYVGMSAGRLADIMFSSQQTCRGLAKRIEDSSWPKRDFDQNMAVLKDKAKLPKLKGSTDIYSYNQAYLFSSGNLWNSRPVLQSYSVYTSDLASKNSEHLFSKNAPDNILFKVEPIDGRLPSLEDGASWPAILQRYHLIGMENDFLLLRKSDYLNERHEMPVIKRSENLLGENIAIPHGNVFAEIEIVPSLLGRVASFVFKPSQLRIKLILESGEQKEFRIVSGMAKSGFVVSPFVSNTEDFALLYNAKYLFGKRVKSLSVEAPRMSWLWKNIISVTFKKIDLPKQSNIANALKFESPVNAKYDGIEITSDCEGAIDEVNGASSLQINSNVPGLLKVSGWLALKNAPRLGDVFLLLKSDGGQGKLIKTKRVFRPDVGAHFKNDALNWTGYAATADVSSLNGTYELGLAFKPKGVEKLLVCPKFNIPVNILRHSANA